MIGLIESIVILAIGIALVLIAKTIHIEDIVNKVIYIVGIILVVIGILFLLVALLGLVI